MSQTPLPTDAELEILGVLWARGPSTVREVLERLGAERAVGYTTVLKLLQIMLEKGLVKREEAQRTHVYEAAVAREETEYRLVEELAGKAFRGSVERLALRALSRRTPDAAELQELRELLKRMEAE